MSEKAVAVRVGVGVSAGSIIVACAVGQSSRGGREQNEDELRDLHDCLVAGRSSDL